MLAKLEGIRKLKDIHVDVKIEVKAIKIESKIHKIIHIREVELTIEHQSED